MSLGEGPVVGSTCLVAHCGAPRMEWRLTAWRGLISQSEVNSLERKSQESTLRLAFYSAGQLPHRY